MKKLSEILKIALVRYEEEAAYYTRKGYSTATEPGMCFALISSRQEGEITRDEEQAVRYHIGERLRNRQSTFGYLASFLKSQKKASNYPARLAYYKRWIAQLENKGE